MRRFSVLIALLASAVTASAASAASGSGRDPSPVAIERVGLSELNSLRIPCTINGYSVECAVDTASSTGVYLGGNMIGLSSRSAFGQGTPISCLGPTKVTSVTGTENACAVRVRVTVGGRAVVESGVLNQAYGWLPLIGLPTLKALYPAGFSVNFSTLEILPLGETGTTR